MCCRSCSRGRASGMHGSQPMVHVGLNALFLEPRNIGGTETYTRELVRELGRCAPDWRFTLYMSREGAAVPWDLPRNISVSIAPVRAVSRPQRLAWELVALPVIARRDGLDLLHSLGTTQPILCPVPTVVTVHDLIYEHFPEAFPGVRARVLGAVMPRMVRRADRVIADSRATAADLSRVYGVPPGSIDVIYLGPGRSPIVVPEEEAKFVRARLGVVPGRYVLSVATTQPHKNLDRLIEAMAMVSDAERDARLVLVGARGTALDSLRATATARGLSETVVFTGWIEDRALDALFAGARAFVYPSLCEGFGLPLLEAMERGVPVISSAFTSLPEVGGDAVEYCDATDPTDIARAILAVLRDDGLARSLVDRGNQRLDQFSWRRAADETLATYRKVLRL